MISTVCALGSAVNCALSGCASVSSNRNGIVSGFGFSGRDVAAKLICRSLQSGSRKVDVQPAPRMRRSTCVFDMVVRVQVQRVL